VSLRNGAITPVVREVYTVLPMGVATRDDFDAELIQVLKEEENMNGKRKVRQDWNIIVLNGIREHIYFTIHKPSNN